VALTEDCAWIVREGKLLLEQQNGSRWRGLWKLPVLPGRPAGAQLMLAFDYPFTHHRVTLSVYRSRASAGLLSPAQQWVALKEIDTIALAAPHRRAIQRLVMMNMDPD